MKWFGSKSSGFTLAETLISLMILSIISIYTIPKLMVGTQSIRYSAIVKEVASSISAACSIMKTRGEISKATGGSATYFDAFLPYLNYIKEDTSSLIDDTYGDTSKDCSTDNCYKLHNGAILFYYASGQSAFWSGNAPLSALKVLVDPDGKYSGSTTGQGKSTWLVLYYNCRLATSGTISNGTLINGIPESPDPTENPPYLDWK